eukprot:403364625
MVTEISQGLIQKISPGRRSYKNMNKREIQDGSGSRFISRVSKKVELVLEISKYQQFDYRS